MTLSLLLSIPLMILGTLHLCWSLITAKRRPGEIPANLPARWQPHKLGRPPV